MSSGVYPRSIFSVMALLRFSRLENVATALRAWVEVAVGIGVLSLAGAIGFYAFVSAPKPAKHEHSMMCLAAYMAYRQVVGGPEEAALKRLKGCEDSRPGDEPIRLDPREHALVIKKYEACLAAHLLLSSDLEKYMAHRKQECGN